MRKKESGTVLIVDDDPIILFIVKEQISAYGYQPIVASSGEEALKINPTNKIDLLLTDIMMPGINGIDLAKQFITRDPEIKVLFMSGVMCPSIAHINSGDEGAFVQKPFTSKTLLSKMRDVLRRPAIDPTIDHSDS